MTNHSGSLDPVGVSPSASFSRVRSDIMHEQHHEVPVQVLLPTMLKNLLVGHLARLFSQTSSPITGEVGGC